MNIDTVARQIQSVAKIFNDNVAGAAGYANGVRDQVWLPAPAAYVIPGEEDAEPNESMGALQQIIRERVMIVVLIDTLSAGGTLDIADRRGQAAAQQIQTMRDAIFKAILNWRPNEDGGDATSQPSARGFYYIGGRYPEEGAFDRSRFFYQFTFGLDVTITEEDGWTATGTPLTDVRATVTDQATGDTLATADAPL